jgi:hypothetical protein
MTFGQCGDDRYEDEYSACEVGVRQKHTQKLSGDVA